MCHISCVTCEVSGVRCRVSPFIFFFWGGGVVELVGGGSVINGVTPSYKKLNPEEYWILQPIFLKQPIRTEEKIFSPITKLNPP